MTTAAQIKKLVKPLLERHGDLALVRSWIILKPVHHLLRAVLIDRTSTSARFQPIWVVMPLCERTGVVRLHWEGRLTTSDIKLWEWKNPRVPSAFVEVIEQMALPLLRGIDTLDDFIALTKEPFVHNDFNGFHLKKAVVDVARGDLDSARSCCAVLAAGGWKNEVQYDLVTKTFCPSVEANDRPALIRLLHEWEAYTVEHLGIAHLWEPTPFPIELQSPEA